MSGWLLLWVTILISLYTDVKSRRIYNKVVIPAMVLGLGLNGLEQGWPGLVFSLEGLLVGLGLFLIPFLLGGIGAGDVKLMGAIGAIKGFPFVILTGLGTGVAGGVIALIILIRQGQLLTAIKRLSLSLRLFLGGDKGSSLQTLDKTEYSSSFPYGVAITCGTLMATFYWF
ncbi:MAG TPA: A24 family peptidase [Bacillota bacterium]|nr:A24 family peptidase [Bacillota bacterium]